MPLVEALAEQAPLVRVRVVEAFSGTIRSWIEAEKIDLGIVYDLGPLRHLVARRLVRDELVVVGPAGRFATADWSGELPFASLAQEPLIVPGVQHGLRQLLDREAARAGIDLNVAQDIDSLDTILALVARGRGIAILPHCAVIDPLWSRRISAARLAGGGLWRRLTLVRNPSHVLTHASVRVEDLTRRILSSLIAEGGWRGRMEND